MLLLLLLLSLLITALVLASTWAFNAGMKYLGGALLSITFLVAGLLGTKGRVGPSFRKNPETYNPKNLRVAYIITVIIWIGFTVFLFYKIIFVMT